MPELRPYQVEDGAFFVKRRRSLILYEMRLGKTPTAIHVTVSQGCEAVVIICPKNALYVWRDHAWDWDPRDPDVRVCHGSASHRIVEWSKPRTGVTYYVTTYGSFLRDLEDIRRFIPIPNMVILDEAKRIRNRKAIAFKAIEKYCRHSGVRVLMLEGTPTNKGPKDFWTMFHLVDKQRFGSYFNFIRTFYETVEGAFGGFELVQPRNLDQFHRLLREFSRIRYRADVRPEMPRVQRVLVPVDLNPEQLRLYHALAVNRFEWTSFENLVVAPTSLELSIRLRQLLICPPLLDGNLGLGSAWDAFIETLEDTEDPNGPCYVVYCPFKQPFQHWRKDLDRRGYKNLFQLDGSVSPRQQKEQIEGFQATRGILFCTIRYAEAFSLTPSTTAFFIGQEWNPNTNRQAEDRLIPQEGTNPITAYYYAHNDTVELGIVKHLDAQQRIIDKTMGVKDE